LNINGEDMYKNNRETTDLTERLICIGKVSKTTTGGRRLAFAALVVVGDGKGRVGFGTGKAKEVGDARNKALENAKRSMIRVPLKEGRTIHHDCEGKFGCGHVLLRPAAAGTGIISGGPMRSIFECLGVQDVVSKSLGTNNSYGMVLATFEALKGMNSPRNVADRRLKHVSEIIRRRNMVVAREVSETADQMAGESIGEDYLEKEHDEAADEMIGQGDYGQKYIEVATGEINTSAISVEGNFESAAEACSTGGGEIAGGESYDGNRL
jgi:small subunit ribosomal protein S5